MTRFVWLFVCVLAVAGRAEATTRTVCKSGCAYTSLQTAINEAAPGDTILLRAGEVFTGNYVLKVKPASSSYITIRSDAADSAFPAAGVRLVPEGKTGANTKRSALARLVGQGASYKSTPVVRTEPGAHHYRLQFLEIDGTANVGYETLVQLGENTSNQTSASAAPSSLVLDRVYLHGHAVKGMKRGVAIDGRDIVVRDSYISDIKSLSDAQAIAGVNGPGPFTIENNYLEASGENIMFGGSDPKIANLVPSDMTISRNLFTKPLAWRNEIMKAPSSVTVSAGSGGSLAAGTHYFKVVAIMAAGGATLVSAPSTETSVSVSASGSVKLSWSAVSGADAYRVYRGSSSGGQSVYMETSGAVTSLTYTGSSQKSGTPAKSGSRWAAKNLIEFKNGQRATIDGNVFEHNWDGFQQGYAIVFTPRNQENTAPWSAVRDITFTNNIVRDVAAGVNILGTDDIHPSQQATNIRIANNVFEIDTAFGGKGIFLTMTSGPTKITIDHNTIFSTGTLVNVGGPAITGFVYTHNLSRHNTYGVQGQNYASGLSTLEHYMPGYVFTGNVLAGGKASLYPAGNFFPTVAQFDGAFVDPANGDFTVKAGSLGTGVVDVGVDMGDLATAMGEEPPPSDVSASPAPPTDSGGTLPEDWSAQDIGLVGALGGSSYASGTFTLTGAGADIWGTADAFQYAWTTLAGDGSIVARVATVKGAAAWTKAGVMIRATTSAGAAQASMFVSTGKGLAFQRRPSTGGSSVNTAGGSGVAPQWVRLTRRGNVVTAAVSRDGASWTTVGSDTIALSSTALVGLAVSSHDTAALATATFDHVAVSAGTALPDGWRTDDIGSVGRAGSATESAGTFTVKGAGADIWGTADALHFTSRTLDADGDIVARVAGVVGTQAWTKVGVMIRASLDANAQQALILVSLGKGSAFQRRTVTGGTSLNTAGPAVTAPRWVKLSRRGSTITASISSDGKTWTVVGSDDFSMAGTVHVGLAVSSHDASQLATGTFDNVSVTPAP